MNPAPAVKLRMMQGSIRCLVFGLLGLLPAVGLPFAIAALVLFGGIRQQEKHYWNPAQPYRMIGGVCAALGMIGWFLVAMLIASVMIANSTK